VGVVYCDGGRPGAFLRCAAEVAFVDGRCWVEGGGGGLFGHGGLGGFGGGRELCLDWCGIQGDFQCEVGSWWERGPWSDSDEAADIEAMDQCTGFDEAFWEDGLLRVYQARRMFEYLSDIMAFLLNVLPDTAIESASMELTVKI
jgi:hypothetical protein